MIIRAGSPSALRFENGRVVDADGREVQIVPFCAPNSALDLSDPLVLEAARRRRDDARLSAARARPARALGRVSPESFSLPLGAVHLDHRLREVLVLGADHPEDGRRDVLTPGHRAEPHG